MITPRLRASLTRTEAVLIAIFFASASYVTVEVLAFVR